MHIMLDCSPKKIAEYSERYDYAFWQLRTPLTQNRVAGVPYGLDNGAFSGFDEKTWLKLVEEAHADTVNRPLWVTAPDVVGSAARTLDLFDFFKRKIYPLPVALVAQDGIGNFRVPLDHQISAIFIGGSDTFKYSSEALHIAKAARMAGKLVHVGRINSAERARFWRDHADSCDGSGMSRFDERLDVVINALRGTDDHPCLFSQVV